MPYTSEQPHTYGKIHLVAFRNNDIYVVEDEDYKEPRERQPKVQYKLKIADNPAAQNMPHEEAYSDNNYESIDETAV